MVIAKKPASIVKIHRLIYTFPMQIIYLDANATMPALDLATDELIKILKNQGNASSPHVLGRKQRTLLDKAREEVALALNAKDKQIYFNSGSSEGNRWLVDAVLSTAFEGHAKPKVLTTIFEHPSLMQPLKQASNAGRIELSVAMPNKAGEIFFDPKILSEADVVFVAAAHSETGIAIDWDALLPLIPAKTILITDATQTMARFDAFPQRVDAAVLSAHKMGGIAGSGAIMIRGNAKLLIPPWQGGGQESGLRPGTECTPLIVAFGTAAQNIKSTRSKHAELAILRDEIENELLNAWPFARVLGQECVRLPNTLAIVLDNVDGEALRIAIDTTNVCVGFGSACSALAPEPSEALLALGLTPKQARATIRISLPMDITKAEIKEALSRLIPVGLRLHDC